MDTGKFDAWTRRRFGLGASGLAAGLLGLAAAGETLARKKTKKKKCRGGKKNCGRKCVNLRTDVNNCGRCGNRCARNRCFNGTCECVDSNDCPEGCFCHPDAQTGGSCGGASTSRDCNADFLCPLGEVCLALFLKCTEACAV